MNRFETLPLNQIHVDAKLRMRARPDPGQAAKFARGLAAGEQFPPVMVYHDGSTHWLADGFQRYEAHRLAAQTEIVCEVRRGGFRDALLCACGADVVHGRRRTNADKRLAVSTVLADPEWSRWSDREIARMCAVSNMFVGKVRAKLAADRPQLGNPIRRIVRGDKVYEMDTSWNGRRPKLKRRPTVLMVIRGYSRYLEPGKFTDTGRLLRDGTGRPVPDALRSVFLTAREIRMCNKLLYRVRKVLGRARRRPGGEHLSMESLLRLEQLYAEFRGAEPYIICPAYHEKAHRSCGLCGLSKRRRVVSGFIPVRDYAALSLEQREVAESGEWRVASGEQKTKE